MNELQKLKALIEINGDTEKYKKGMQALNPSPIEQVTSAVTGSGRLTSLIVGVVLIGTACYFNPQIPAQFWLLVDQLQTSEEVELPTNKGGR